MDEPVNLAVTPAPLPGSSVMGVIDGKFEAGYLITIIIDSDKLKGALYQAPQNAADQTTQNQSENMAATAGVLKRRRKKICEMKKRDPAYPKPKRSGFNFFFAEQHGRLKPMYPRKDRAISRMIGELWDKLKEAGNAEKAVRDKERYRTGMEDYKERLETVQVITDALPIQQQLPEPEVTMMEVDEKIENGGGDSP